MPEYLIGRSPFRESEDMGALIESKEKDWLWEPVPCAAIHRQSGGPCRFQANCCLGSKTELTWPLRPKFSTFEMARTQTWLLAVNTKDLQGRRLWRQCGDPTVLGWLKAGEGREGCCSTPNQSLLRGRSRRRQRLLLSPRCSASSAKLRQALARRGLSVSWDAAWVSNCCALPQKLPVQGRPCLPVYCNRASRGLACCAASMRASQPASMMVDNPSLRQWMSFSARPSGRPSGSSTMRSHYGQEPGSHLGRIATQMGQALGGLHRQFGHVALRVFQRCPDLHQLRGVVRRLDEFNGQSAHDALSSTCREGAVLAQQTSGVQRFTGLPCLACGL